MSNEKNGKPSAEANDLFDGFGGEGPAETVSEAKTPPVVEDKREESPMAKIVRYHSRRSEFGACVVPKQILRDGQGRVVRETPAKYVQFKDNKLETSDPQLIEWLESYINNPNHSKDEVFRMPELDPLIEGGFVEKLDEMQMTELRAACRQRGLNFATSDDESALRYKLLKRLSGFGAKKTTTKSA